MTPEKRLSAIFTLISANADLPLSALQEHPEKFLDCTWNPALDCAARLILECKEQLSKQTGGTGRLTVAKRIVKDAINPNLTGQFCVCGSWYLTDGYRIFRFEEKIEAIPEAYNPPAGFMAKVDEYFCDCGPAVDLPTVAQLKEHIAKYGLTRSKGYRDPHCRYPVGKAGYNAFYLLDALQALGDCIAEQIPGKTGQPDAMSGIVIRKIGKAEACFLLPVKA